MGVIFRDTLRALVRTRSLYIWSLIFPIVLSTMFMFMFANLDGERAFDPVPTGIVADEAWDASPFAAVVDDLAAPATTSCWRCAPSPAPRRPARR